MPHRSLVIVGLVVVGLSATGIGGWLIGSQRPAPRAMLLPGSPVAVTIARYGPQPVGPAASTPWTPEGEVTVTRPAEVARLQADVNNLPLMPAGSYACPYSDGSHYQLRFSFANGDRRTVVAEINGCQLVGFEDDSWGPDHPVAWSMTDHRLLDDLNALLDK